MKRMLRILLLAVLMVPIGAKVNAQCSGTMCSVTIQMMDEYGDGWYDYDSEPFYVKVYQGTTLRGQATLGAGASGTQTIAVCSSDSVRFVFDGEDSYEESSFTILNGDGTTIIASASCSDYTSGQTITTAEVVCPSCIAPFNLSVDASDAENVVVSWIGSASGYEVVVLPATAAFDSSVAVSVTDTVVALDTLTSGTAYSVWVRTDCGSEYSTWAGPVSFAPGLYTMTANSSDTLHACGITIVDDGGLGGDYAPNQNTTLYLYPSDATQMLVLSGSSHSESTYDYVTIYSGIGTSGEVLFTDNGIDVLTTIDTIYSESPVTIVFISDYSNQYDGFQINVSCIDAPDCRRVENFACVDSMTTAHTATFTWQSDASSFQIEYKKAEDTTWTEETTNDTAYTLTGLDATTTYNVRVKALCGSDESLYSAVLNVTTTVACPAPTGLRAVLTPGDGTVATLTWSDPTGSAWQICLNGDTNNYIDVTDTAYEMTDLTPEQAITAKVRRDCSEEEEGYSEWTATITFTPTDAYSITVNDGTATNGYVPIYGYYVDNHIHTQFIVPAADLSAMAFGIVNKLTFYASNASINWGSASFKVYLTETDATGVSSLNSVDDMEEVYSGSLGISGNQMVVTFTTPYQYMGGNLLVAFEQPTSGSYVSCTWYGVSATGASMGGYGSSSVYQQNFLPKMTIDYTPGEEPSCLPVSSLAVSGITGHAATLTWSGDAGSYTVYTVSSEDTTSYATVSDTTVDLTGLSGETQYTFGVTANCGGDESMMRVVNFTTLVSCPAPTDLRAVLTPGDGTVATLSWHEAGEATAWQICLNDDMDNLIDVTDTTYEMTNLTPEQAITAKVRAVCGEDDTSAWTATITFTPTDAYSITVNDGTTTNSYVPIYGSWVDNHIKSQFIIPAADLSAMQFGNVTKLTFHSSDANKTWNGAVFEVYLTETNATGVSSLNPVADMEQVYTGSLSIANNVMEITLTTPYLYMGGNLLVAFEEPTSGSWSGCSWYGVSATGASMGGYGSSVYQQNFLPKMTIDFTPSDGNLCVPVMNLRVVSSMTDETSITLSWEDTVNNGASYNVYILGEADTTLAGTTTDTSFTVTGLTSSTAYTFGVVVSCGADDSSLMRTVQARTTCGFITDIPWMEDFNSSNVLDCWMTYDFDNNENSNWTVDEDGYAVSGYNDMTSANDWLVTPGIVVPTAAAGLSFTWRAMGNSYDGDYTHMTVLLSTSGTDTAAFTDTLYNGNPADGVWSPFSAALDDYADDTIYVAFIHDSYNDDGPMVDSVSVRFTMAPVVSIVASAQTVDINETVTFHANLVEGLSDGIIYTWSNTLAGSTIDNYTDSISITYTAAGVDTVSLTATNAHGTHTATVVVNVRNCQAIATFPFVETFDATSATRDCWNFVSNNTANVGGTYGMGFVTVSNRETWRFSSYSSASDYNQYGFSPSMDLSAYDSVNVRVVYATYSNAEELYFGYITASDTVWDPTVYYTSDSSDWQSQTFRVPGDAVKLAVHYYANYKYYAWIDSVIVTTDNDTPQPTQYTVTLSSANATMGTVSPAGATTVDEGANFSATATANDGYHFVSWTDAAGAVVSTANPYTFTVTADVALTATFEANSTPTYYTVTVSSANTTMGTVSCTPSGSVEAGTSVTATATPANNHIFTGWVDANGDTVSRANPYTFTVTADVTLVGTFRYDGVGIDEAEVSNVSLFPNPATSTFTVSATGMKEATVIDLNGRTVMTQNAADGTATFDVSKLAKGTYFVRIVGEQATAVRKLVVK